MGGWVDIVTPAPAVILLAGRWYLESNIKNVPLASPDIVYGKRNVFVIY